jgi:integrase
MSLFKREGSNIWWTRFTLPGYPRIRQSTGETSRAEAQKVEDRIKAELWKSPPALTGKTWSGAVQKWTEHTERSAEELAAMLYFCKHYPDRKLSEVTPESIDKALSSFCKTAQTYTRHRARISALLKLSGIDIVLEKRKATKVKEREWLTHEQWEKLKPELPAHMRNMAEFAISTGLRQSNVLNLAWKKVDLKRRLVWVDAVHSKSGRAISVPLSDDALDVLHRVKGEHPEFVFTYRGKTVTEIKTAWISANVRAGTGGYVNGKYVGFTWHGLRHTWATWHVQNGTPLDVLQKLGGWASYTMVLRYAHHAPSYLASFVNNTKGKL